MKNSTPIFPGFHMPTLRRKPRYAQQKLVEEMTLLKQKSFKQIGGGFGGISNNYSLLPNDNYSSMTGILQKGESRRAEKYSIANVNRKQIDKTRLLLDSAQTLTSFGSLVSPGLYVGNLLLVEDMEDMGSDLPIDISGND